MYVYYGLCKNTERFMRSPKALKAKQLNRFIRATISKLNGFIRASQSELNSSPRASQSELNSFIKAS